MAETENNPSNGWWTLYRRHVKDVIFPHTDTGEKDVSYWRNETFCNILTYITPLSLVALIPSVYMAFIDGAIMIGLTDLLTFLLITIITFCRGIRLEIRKYIFILSLTFLSVALLSFLPFPGPGLLFLLAVTIFSALIYSSSTAYISAWANTLTCVIFAFLIYFKIPIPLSASHGVGAWIAISSNLVLLSFGCAKCLDFILEGLTDSLKAKNISEAKLDIAIQLNRGNERRFQSLIEHSLEMITLVTPGGKIIYASPSVSKTLGFSADELLSVPPFDLVFKGDAEALSNKVQDLIASPGKSFFSQHRMVHKSGRLIWCEGTITNMFHEPSIEALVSNFRNITERKELEGLYLKANKLARLGSWEIDVLRNKLYWSDITKELHEVEIDFEPDVETAINFYKEGESRNSITEAVTEAIKSGKPWDLELQIITAKQNERWIRAMGEVELKNGVCVRIFGNFQDIDVRKKGEIERKRIANDLLMHSQNLEQFAYIVSHNLRAPVANILGLANILQNTIPNEDRERAQKYLFTAAAQMDETIKDLNKILQIRAEYSDFKESINLPHLLRDVQSSIQHIISKESVRIHSTFSEVSEITAIKSYIHSIFYNLILNSIKYRKKGVSPIVEIKSEIIDGKIQLVFRDNGSGIDLKKEGGNIFGLYKRFHPDVEGKGVGLYMIKTQIEVLGGSISVKSEPNEGAEFLIVLPLA